MTKFGMLSILVLGAIFLFVPPSIALLCYDCVNSALTDDVGLNTTCPDPFQPSGITTCSALNCMIGWADLKTKGYIVYRSCVPGQYPSVITPDKCEAMNQIMKMYKFFVYQGMCCNQSMQAYDYNGITYNFQATSCICTTDNCNGAVPNYVTKDTSSASTPKAPVTPKTTKVVTVTKSTVMTPLKNAASGVVVQSAVVPMLCAVVFASAAGRKVIFAK